MLATACIPRCMPANKSVSRRFVAHLLLQRRLQNLFLDNGKYHYTRFQVLTELLHRDMLQSSPASSLCHDILHEIFSMNCPADEEFSEDCIADLLDDISLHTARYTSQVCSSWRTVMLSSPSIWAHILNLDHLSFANDNWTNEVLKRTKNCSLSIYVSLEPHWRSIDLFFSIINDCWNRLQRVAFTLSVSTRNDLHDPRWRLLNRHGPNIEIFVAFVNTSYHLRTQPLTPLSIGKLFGNNAPHLHTLSTTEMFIDICPPSSFAAMRYLKLEHCDIYPEALHALAQMKSLEYFYVLSENVHDTMDAYPDIGATIPQFELPNLKVMDITAKLSTLLAFLGHIIPPQQCEFSFTVYQARNTLSHTELDQLRRSFITYYQCFQQSNTVDILSIRASPAYLYIANQISGNELTLCGEMMFDFAICKRSGVLGLDWDCITETIVQPLSSEDLSAAKTVELELDFPQSILLSNIHLATLLYSLAATETLLCKSCMIELITLIESRNDRRTIFPRLHTIILCEDENKLSSIAIMRFIIQRRKTATPIRCINLQTSKARNQEELLLLEGQKDLQVVWGTKMQKLIDELWICFRTFSYL